MKLKSVIKPTKSSFSKSKKGMAQTIVTVENRSGEVRNKRVPW